MKYKADHKSEVHKKLLTTASQQIRAKGLNQVSVKSVMQSEGMTVGGFYAHFSSKEDLLIKAVTKAFQDTWTQFYEPLEACNEQQWMRQMTTMYMTQKHLRERDNMCPIAGLMSEVAKSDPVIKQTFQDNLKITLDKVENKTGSVKATGIMALFTGSIQMAAACNDEEFQLQILSDSVQCAAALMNVEINNSP